MKWMKKGLALAAVGMLLFSACSSAGSSSSAPAVASSSQPAASSASAATPEAKIGEGRTLVVGIWGAEQEELVREHVIKPFEEETGAKVELILGGAGDRYSKLYAEEANPSMDVMYLNKAQTEQGSRDGMILEPDPAMVTNYDKLYDIAKCGNGYGVALTETGIMYSTEAFPTPPDSWEVFTDPANAGKILPYSFPSTQGTAFIVMMTRVKGGSEATDSALGFEAIAAMKPFPLVSAGIPEINQAFLDGDAILAPQMSGYVYSAAAEGIPVGYARPKEGAVLGMNCAVIPKNTQNADLAKIFINYHLAQACQEAYAQRLYYGPTNAEIELPAELADMVVYGEEDVKALIALDNEAITAQEADWTEEWNTKILE